MIVSNQGYTLAQANQYFLDVLNQGNATLKNLEQAGHDCCVAKDACAEAQRKHAQELAELTQGVQKLEALFKRLVAESQE